jgi:hypothetical protein
VKLLAGRQPDDPSKRKPVHRQLVFRGDEPLLLGLQLYPGTKHIDARDHALLVLIEAVLIERLRSIDLRADAVDTGHIRKHKEISVACCEHHQVAIAPVGVPRRLFRFRSRFPILDVGPVK